MPWPASSPGAFKRLRIDAAQIAVTAGSVVEHFEVGDVGDAYLVGFVHHEFALRGAGGMVEGCPGIVRGSL